MTRISTGFSGLVQNGEWPPPRSWARPERLELSVETLPGVGPTFAKRLRSLGLETVGDVLFRKPRRYETAADEISISQLWGNDEVVISGSVVAVKV